MQYRYIFFDVANTLLYKKGLYDTIIDTLKAFNLKMDKKTLIQRHKIVSEIIVIPDKTSEDFYEYFNSQLLYSLGVIPKKIILDAIYRNCVNLPWKRFDDTKVLKELNISMGIISNWDNTLSEKLGRLFDIKFNNIIISSQTGAAKPNLNIFSKALSEVKYNAKEILYIGDSIKLDVEPAFKKGVQAVLIDRDDIFPLFEGIRIKSLYEMKEILEN